MADQGHVVLSERTALRHGNASLTVLAATLTFGTGAVDVACFTRLGAVFASVMTGNLVLLGLSVARASGDLAGHALVAIGGYVVGAAVGTRLTRLPEQRARVGEPRVVCTLLIEGAVLLAFTVGWEVGNGAHPATAWQFTLLAASALAMGLQSAAARGLGPTVATTYLTGTLTGVVASVVSNARPWHVDRGAVASLAAAVAGAAAGGAVLAVVPAALPALPLAAVTGAILAIAAAGTQR